jgi:formate-dependent nitrite reductase membrane component NrfD
LTGHYVPDVVRLPVAALAVATAGYSAFLFGQAEGRDFWQSPLLLPQLLVGAQVAGAAALLVVAFFARVDVEELWWLGVTMAGGLALQAIVLVAEVSTGHANADAARAARLISRGPWRTPFWAGVVAAGTVLPIVLVWPNPYSAVLGALLALVGLWIYEDLWLKAGQAVPLS